jgi:flagellar L-ring protein precursor FlgH
MMLFFVMLSTTFAQQTQPAQKPSISVVAPQASNQTQISGNGLVAPGSLWSEKKVRMMVGMEGNARQVGDLITIVITEQTSSQVRADTTTRREASISNSIGSLFGLKNKILQNYPNIGGELAMTTASENAFRGDGNTSRIGMLDGVVTCKVVEVHPNGNLVVFGWKEVRANKETQYLSLSGVVRPQDIRNDNTIPSDLIAEARIEYTGTGVVGDKQAPGVGARIMDNVWPF